jgi:hypothetical protein
MFCWYWLADLCADEGIPFILGHALHMKAIHGGKAKNDRIDSKKIAVLLRSEAFPFAYVDPPLMRSTRDLLRSRLHFARRRAELLTHIQHTFTPYNRPSPLSSCRFPEPRPLKHCPPQRTVRARPKPVLHPYISTLHRLTSSMWIRPQACVSLQTKKMNRRPCRFPGTTRKPGRGEKQCHSEI